MVEVTMRTSKDAALSVSGKQNSVAFDVRSWQGLTELLKAGRDAGMNDDAYADFRDIVLRYAQSGGTDKTLQTSLERIIPTLTKKPVAEPVRASVAIPAPTPMPAKAVQFPPASGAVEKSTAVSYAQVGIPRPRPQFGVIKPTMPAAEVIAAPEAVLDRVAHISFVPHNLPVASEVQAVPTLQVPITDDSIPASVPAPQRKIDVTTTPPVPAQEIVLPPPPEPVKAPQEPLSVPATPTSRETKTVEEYRKRIADIKRTVNAEIGNPVMLIDAGNPVGREYMTALLNAMKATSGGAPGTLVSSMEILEQAFEKILAAPKTTEAVTVVSTELPTAPETSAQVPVPAEPEVIVDNAKRWEGTEVAEEAKVEVNPSPLPSLKDQINGVHATPLPEVEMVKAEIPEASEQVVVEVLPTLEPISLHAENTTPALSSDVSKHLAKGVGQAHLDVTLPGDTKQEPPESVKEDLHSPEMDMGLHQLLSEWKIFRGSGLFGTGPGGAEHPLYLKLKDMPMSLVSSGSWEKASKEDVISIRDYTNGWRHEQGISFIPSESFDTYLRRVVKRVLKRQGI